ncbi:MAG: ABC transporter permease [Jatrophihabitans sp.]
MSNAITLIARREITSRLQQRGYRIGFGVALLIAVIACIVPAFFSGSAKATTYDVGIATSAPGLPAALTAVGTAQHIKIRIHNAAADDARKQVKDGKWDAAIVPGDKLYAQKTGDAVVGIVQNAFRLSQTVRRLDAAGLSAAQTQRALNVRALAVSSTESGDSAQRTVIAIVTIVVLFTQLATFCTWVAMGVVEEKASRVVELILSSVRPLQLLTGKLAGIGALAAGQVLLLGAVAIAAATAAGTITIPASGLLTVLVAFVGFVLGFAFFAAVAAALGSTVSRQEEVSGVLAPVTLTLTVCYAAGFAAAVHPDSTLSRVLSVVPPISSIAMPARIARGDVPVLDVVLAVVLLVLATAAIIVVAARIYRASVLHSGTRVSLKRAWRGEAVGGLA